MHDHKAANGRDKSEKPTDDHDQKDENTNCFQHVPFPFDMCIGFVSLPDPGSMPQRFLPRETATEHTWIIEIDAEAGTTRKNTEKEILATY